MTTLLSVRGTAAWLLAALVLVLAAGRVHAAPPPAGSVIGNQATATYTDSGGVARTSISNLVQTTVTQIFSHTLTANQSKQVAPGGTVYFAHTLVNTGNGTDTYTLSTFDRTGGNITPTSIVIYADANGDGVPDNTTAITTTGPIASGGNFKFVVAAVIPATEAAGDTDTITVGSAGNAGDTNNYTASDTAPAVAGGNLDTVTVTANAVINVTKSFSVQSGGTSGTACVTPFDDVSCRMIRVTLTYTNSGQAAASNVVLADVIGTAATPTANFTYVPATNATAANRPLWSGSATTLTDAAGGDPAGIAYDFGVVTNTVTAVITSVAPGQSGTLSFSIIVKNATPVGDPVNVALTANTARFCYNDGAAQFPAGSTSANCSTTGVPTNTATYTVSTTLAANVVANNTSASAADAAGDNVVTVATANQGTAVNFVNFIWNTGNVTDRFNITVDATNATPSGATGAWTAFPAGTTFQLFTSDGAGNPIAPLTDTNGDGIPDTGPVAAGAFVRIVLRANLLPNTIDGGSAPYSVNKVATSTVSGVANSVTDRLTTIVSRVVDLTNTTVGGAGAGFDPTATAGPHVTQNINAGGTANFTLWVTNNGPGSDNFDLIVRDTATNINTAGVTTNQLPSGWTVRFVATGNTAGGATCPANGQVITNTGTIVATGSCEVRAEIAVPISQAGITQSVFFRAASPVSTVYGGTAGTSASFDAKQDRIVVTGVGGVTLQPNRAGQVFPGGNIVYTHQVCNTGTTTLAANSITVTHLITIPSPAAGWTNAVYVDANANGVLDIGTDTQIAAGGTTIPGALAAGACLFVFDNVFAPAGATAGATNVVTITATHGTAGTGVATDTTNVITGDLALSKEQATVSCTAALTVGGGVAAYNALTWVSTNLAAQTPGSCIAYRITATNSGSSNLTNLIVSDAVPQYTTHETGACQAAQDNAGAFAAAATAPADEAQGQVATGTIATVVPGAVVRLYYCVQLDS